MSPLGGLGLNLLVKPDTCSSGSAKAYVSVLPEPSPHSIPWLGLKVSLGSNPSWFFHLAVYTGISASEILTDLDLFRKTFTIRIWEIAVHVSTSEFGKKHVRVGKNDTSSALLHAPGHTCILYRYEAKVVKSRAKIVALSPTPDGR